jgi:hypothetical protein
MRHVCAGYTGTQLNLLEQPPAAPRFDGATYDHAQDSMRLRSQLQAVRAVMSDGQWHTIPELARKGRGSESSISARIRDMRKEKFGGATVERRRITGGLYEYRLVCGEAGE